MEARLSFLNGAETVTGAHFLLSASSQKETLQVLIDCGLLQGVRFSEDENRKPFPYDPKTMPYLIVTHAHLDHIGRIPKLVHDGFRGVIYSTPATKEIARLMFADAVGLLSLEASKHDRPPLYDHEDVEETLLLWKTVPYHKREKLGQSVSFSFKNAGHILGSAFVEVMLQKTKLVFTGDLGTSAPLLLPPPEEVPDAQYMVLESVYGDRIHESIGERSKLLADAVREVARRSGTLLIPVFSLSRAQSILFELNHLVESREIPSIPMFFDSPLAIDITGVYKAFAHEFKKDVQELLRHDDIFSFPRLTYTYSAQESHNIHSVSGPKVIIAGSGMSQGGRIASHEKRYLPEAKNIVLIVGHQGAGTLGRRLQDGARAVTIDNQKVPVKATIKTISGYSSHADSDDLLSFVEKSAQTLKQVFTVMGEPKSSLFLSQRIRDYLDVNAISPREGGSYTIDVQAS